MVCAIRSFSTVVAALVLFCAVQALPAAAAAAADQMQNKGEGVAEGEELDGVASESALAAVPAGSRAVLERLLDQMDHMRSEMQSLRAGRLESDARARRLCERVDGLETLAQAWRESDDDTLGEHGPEQEQPVEQKPNAGDTKRHRKQASAAPCGPSSWAARTAAVMGVCCPDASGASGGGHRRRAQQATTCPLPATCPSAACAAAFVPYYEDCGAELQGHAAELPLPQFAGFYASCQELDSGAGVMLQPVAVQMFRVLVNTEGAAQAGSMFPGGGTGGGSAGGNLDPLQPLPPLPPPPPPDATAGSGDGTTGVTQYHAVSPPRTSRAAYLSATLITTDTSSWRRSTARTRSSAAIWRTVYTPGWARRQRAASSVETTEDLSLRSTRVPPAALFSACWMGRS